MLPHLYLVFTKENFIKIYATNYCLRIYTDPSLIPYIHFVFKYAFYLTHSIICKAHFLPIPPIHSKGPPVDSI
jgi:hypothetical protein